MLVASYNRKDMAAGLMAKYISLQVNVIAKFNAIAVVCLLFGGFMLAEGIPLANFYPFGNSVGDTALPKVLDTSSPRIQLTTSTFPFFGQDHAFLYVSQ